MEAVEVMKAAYPTRIPLETLLGMLEDKIPDVIRAMKPSSGPRGMKRFLAVVLNAAGVERGTYQLGRTKLFLRAGKGEPIERLLQGDDAARAALSKLQVDAQKEWLRVAAQLVGTSVLTWYRRKQFKAYLARRHAAASKIQKFWRGKKVRVKWLTTTDVVHGAHKKEKAEAAAAAAAAAKKAAAKSRFMVTARGVQTNTKMGKFLRSSKKKRQTHEASRESAGSSADPATDRSHDARAHTRSKSSRRPMGRRELSHAAEEDPELADETPDQAWTRGEVQSKFEVSLTRDEKTNSLGMQLDEFQGEVTVVWVVPGGAADKSGTVQMGDEVVGVDGVESHGLNELKGLVIQAKSTTLLFTIQRRVATTVHSGTVMMLRGGGGSTYDPFELILDSNRVLSFKGKGQEQTHGVVSRSGS